MERMNERNEQPIGPTLPPHWRKTKSIDKSDVNKTDINIDLLERSGHKSAKREQLIGPTLPPHLQNKSSNEDNESDSDSEPIIGPLPQSDQHYDRHNSKFINNASIVSLNDNKSEKEVIKREEWMTQIPKPLAKKLGIKSVHQFSQRSSKSIDLKHNTNDDNKYSNDCKDKQMNEFMDSYNKVINSKIFIAF